MFKRVHQRYTSFTAVSYLSFYLPVGLAKYKDFWHRHRPYYSASPCQVSICFRQNKCTYSRLKEFRKVPLFPPILNQSKVNFQECLLYIICKCCESYRFIAIPEVPFLKKRKQQIRPCIQQAMQAPKFGVNDRFGYASVTQSYNGVNDKSFTPITPMVDLNTILAIWLK